MSLLLADVLIPWLEEELGKGNRFLSIQAEQKMPDGKEGSAQVVLEDLIDLIRRGREYLVAMGVAESLRTK